MKIGTLEIGAGHPCAVIAELGNAHNQDFDRAIRLLDAAKSAGASAAKIQTYLPSEIVALRGDGPAPAPWSDRKMSDLYARAATPFSWIPKLFDHAREIGLPIFSSVFGLEGLALLESLDCPRYKLARIDVEDVGDNNVALVKAVITTRKPIFASTSRPHPPDVDQTKGGWLFCPKGYPPTEIALPMFGHAFVGLSCHSLDPLIPIAAVSRGAKVIEMHMMLRDEPSELESAVSLDEYQFAAMVKSVRQTERLLA